MKRIIVIGCPGSGKSTFSIELHKRINISLYHLDMMYWNMDKTVINNEDFIAKLRQVIKEEEWIIDGNYASTMEMRIAACDTVFFLDYPLDVCLDGVKRRRGKPRVDMPWVETEEDDKFIEFIKNFNLNQRPQILRLLSKYSDKNVIIFTSREEANEFLSSETPEFQK